MEIKVLYGMEKTLMNNKRLKLYYVLDDYRQDIIETLYKMGYKAHHIGSDGLVVQYSNKDDLSIILKVLTNADKRHKELEDITIEDVDKLKEIPFNYIDMNAFKKWFNLTECENVY